MRRPAGRWPVVSSAVQPPGPAVLLALVLLLPGCAVLNPSHDQLTDAPRPDESVRVRAQGPDLPTPAPALPLPTPPAPSVPADAAAAAPWVAPPAAPSPDTPGLAAGPDAGRSPGRNLGSVNSVLRNRLADSVEEAGEPEFTYPDIHSDPAKRYAENFGIEEDHDRFLFPWLLNLVFEDRWLLAERDPFKAAQNQFRHRMKIDIRDPDPDTANFPNGAYTLPKGRAYLENSPLGFYGPARDRSQPRIYQWEFLLRYGLTDNLEFRIFSNGFTYQSAISRNQPATTGFSPLAFDFKVNFWEENTRYHVPAMGVEIYLQTQLGSPAFNNGTQPSINLLFDQSLPFGLGLEWNVGVAGVQNSAGQVAYQLSLQWSLQRQVVKDFDVFFHGFYNEASLPRLLQFRDASDPSIPTIAVVGFGGLWTVNDRLSVFGSFNMGVTQASPRELALMGFAVAF